MTYSLVRSILLIGWVVASSCSNPVPSAGDEKGPCYPNGTCNSGLVCLSNVCVNPGVDAGLADGGAPDAAMAPDGSATDAAGVMDAARLDDAGLPCPGANILHPGTQTRNVNTAVPFVGRARDAQCVAITGTNLVWTDSLEGQIGTGETFNHTFTMVGTHTVTLTAKDTMNTYTAMVTFMIM